MRNLDFTLEPGTFTCLIGPSGCGKTTTLRILMGLEREFSGTVFFPHEHARIAAVFQEPRLLPWQTVEENIRLALPKGASSENLSPLLVTLGLETMTRRYPRELSLGLERRVALARAFAVKPAILFMDEPFVSLDEHTAERLRGLLLELWRDHSVTILMVTHNVREAVQLADRLLLMNGQPADIVADIAVPLKRTERGAGHILPFIKELSRLYPETIRS